MRTLMFSVSVSVSGIRVYYERGKIRVVVLESVGTYRSRVDENYLDAVRALAEAYAQIAQTTVSTALRTRKT